MKNVMWAVCLAVASIANADACDISIDDKCYTMPKHCRSSSIRPDGVFCDGVPVEAFGKEPKNH